MVLKLDQINCLHIELSTRCNARCPMCPRNYRGLDYNAGYPDAEIDLIKFKKILPVSFLKQIKHISFNGNLGDCSTVNDLPNIIEYVFESCDSTIGITTNGSTRTPDWWAKLAHPRLSITFDLDGLEDTHSLYRLDTDWHRTINNARAYIDAGGHATWKMIVFDHNAHQIEQCRDLSRQLGFKIFFTNDHGRNQGPVYTRQGDFSHWLGSAHENLPKVHDLLQHHLTWFETVPSQEWGIDDKVAIDCRHKRQKELYIAADGSVYPCCYLGFYPGSMINPGNSQLEKLVKKNNALEHDLATCLEWFEEVERTWSLPGIDQGRLYNCVRSCGVKQ